MPAIMHDGGSLSPIGEFLCNSQLGRLGLVRRGSQMCACTVTICYQAPCGTLSCNSLSDLTGQGTRQLPRSSTVAATAVAGFTNSRIRTFPTINNAIKLAVAVLATSTCTLSGSQQTAFRRLKPDKLISDNTDMHSVCGV
jgi:hypothetical protein